jgi:MOSC domain-containing protein YiiM
VTGRVFQLNRSSGGVPKLPIREVQVGALGLVGDGHVHTKIHGGPDRAVCLYALEVILALQAEGHPIWPGAAGENVTVSGLTWASLAVGDRLAVGDEVVLVLTRPTTPCKSIASAFADGRPGRIDHDAHPGWSRWYARVERPGTLRVGHEVARAPAG